MRKLAIVVSLLLAAALTIVAAVAIAGRGGGGHGNNFRAQLNGYNEVVGGPGAASTGSVSTLGHGSFSLRIFSDHVHYVLDYTGLEDGTVCCSHIHLAQARVGGNVIAYLCGGGDKPACTTPSGHFEGDIDAADVIGPAEQGIAPGEFDELVSAIRAGATYANVHTTPSYPEGEIRGQIVRGHGHNR